MTACVLDCHCGHTAEASQKTWDMGANASRVSVLGLHCCHPSTQRWCCKLLCYCKAAHDVEAGAFWACLVVENILGITSEIKLFTGPCLGCCSAILYPAKHSHSKREIPTLAKKTVFRGKTLNELGLFWDLFLLYANADWETFPPHQ